MTRYLLRWTIGVLFSILLLSSSAYPQIPFYTDDADTTSKGKFHLEFFNEHDWLQRSSLPSKRQNISNFSLSYGLTDRIELGVSVPFINVFNTRLSRIGNQEGIGDIQFGAKARLLDEREDSRLPALSLVFYFEAPTGNARKQIGLRARRLLVVWRGPEDADEANDGKSQWRNSIRR